MKTAGIICEYNPFHNGHKYHIEKTKEFADRIVCIMSGNFVQRGGIAMCDKFSRAKAAVASGADLVIELPAVFASRSAEFFAYGAVSILHSMGIIDCLSFGSEDMNIPVFSETDSFKKLLSIKLKEGLSFPKARAEAALEAEGVVLPSKPNDILGFEYKKAINKLNSEIKMIPIKRMFQEYHSTSPEGEFASATYIRENPDNLEQFVPHIVYDILKNADFSDFSIYETMVLSHLRTVSPNALAETADCSEGLENRIISEAIKCSSYNELVESIKTKRYTSGRIERIITNSLLGIKSKAYEPEYIRVLALNSTGQEILKEIKLKSSIPVITNLSKQKIDSEALDIDIKAGNLFSLTTKHKTGGIDFTKSPAVINQDTPEYN